jgi:nucleoside-diphosphate-sugar epimerase
VRVVVVGATGNVGTSLLDSLAAESQVESVLGLARRLPSVSVPKVEFARADVASTDLVPPFRGADAVVHLAWLIQPGHDEAKLRQVNVGGTARVLRAVADAGVPSIVYASSVGAYSRGPKHETVDETWPTDGIATSFYSRHKAATESMLTRFEQEHPDRRVVRLRPGLIFKREAASGIRRLFAGPLLPSPLLRGPLLSVVPDIRGLRVQAVHSRDVGDAYRAAIVSDVRGAFNVAADPVLDATTVARALGARTIPVSRGIARGAVAATFALHLQPSEAGWFDMGVGVPLLDSTRAREELGWRPRHTAIDALLELIQGMRDGAGIETPPLSTGTSGAARSREVATGVGSREGV